MAQRVASKNMSDGKEGVSSGSPPQANRQAVEGVLGRAESGFVGLDNQGATCYLNALLQALYMTPELRHGLYAVDPKELGRDDYEIVQEHNREKEKARLAKEHARQKKQEAEGKIQPDPAIVKQLCDMFPEKKARHATIMTQNKSLEAAVDWILEHNGDPLPDDDYDNEDAALGNSNTSENHSNNGGQPRTGDESKGLVARKAVPLKKKAKMVPLELQKLFARLQLLNTRTVSTESLTEHAFGWKNDQGRVQHDVHELIRLLIDKLENEMKFTKANAGLVKALYEGDLANKTRCLECGHVSVRKEKYRDIMLPVAGQEDLVTSLLTFTRPERLSGDNKYFCARCKEKQDALCSQAPTVLPPLLIFALNRSKFDFKANERVKVQEAFKYPVSLDMEPFIDGRAWTGKDNIDFIKVPDLAGDPDEPGTCRNRQRWIPQAWEEAKRRAGDILESSPLSDSGDRASVMFEGEVPPLQGKSDAVDEGVVKGGKGRNVGDDQGHGLVYDLLSVVIHRGSAYSGHYHAFIRDCLNEGRWLPPSGFGPFDSQLEGGVQTEGNGDGGRQKERKMGKRGCAAVDVRANGDASPSGAFAAASDNATGLQKGGEKGRREGQHRYASAMELVVGILSDAPVHEDLQRPFMKISALRIEIRKRLGGAYKWDKLFAKKHGKVVDFIQANANAFLLQENQRGALEVLLISADEEDATASAKDADVGSDAELQKVLRMSLEQQSGRHQWEEHHESKQEKENDALANGAALGSGGDGMTSSIGVVDALAAEKHGRWFSFDDRKVSPISILDLQKPFSGAETAYLLIYRSRLLDEEVPLMEPAPRDVTAKSFAPISTAKATDSSAAAPLLPGSLHMTSVPPEYWMDRVAAENESPTTLKDDRKGNPHGLKLRVWMPVLLSPEIPHLVPKPQASPDLKQIPRDLRAPLLLRLDDRQTVSDLKKEIVRRVGRFYKEVGVPDGAGRLRLSELSPHGPGLFLSKHLPDMATGPSRRRRNRHKKEAIKRQVDGDSKGGSDSGESAPVGGGWAGDGERRPRVAVLGDIGWNRWTEEEASVLVWDGEAVGGVRLSDPGPEERPIRLVVSVLKPTDDVDPFGWIDNVLLQAGVVPTVPERHGARAETCARWTDIYARAGVTAGELVQLMTRRGEKDNGNIYGCIPPSKMCISVLQPSSVKPSADVGRRRFVGQRVEAVQVAGPEGFFQEWKKTGGGRQGGRSETETVGLGLSENSELLVEEQGAASKLISMEQQSLADMEAARRNRLAKVEVEVEDILLDNFKNLGLSLAHDVALNLHDGQAVSLCLESDAHTTSIAHLKARCLLSLAPGLASASTSSLTLSQSLVEEASFSWPPAESSALALVTLLSKVHLESSQDEALEDSAQGASLAAANVLTGSLLRLEWGKPSSTGKKFVRFSVRAGDGGCNYGRLEVVADLKEPVSALKARMVQKAMEEGVIQGEHYTPNGDGITIEWRIRLAALMGDGSTVVQEVKVAENTSSKALRLTDDPSKEDKEQRGKGGKATKKSRAALEGSRIEAEEELGETAAAERDYDGGGAEGVEGTGGVNKEGKGGGGKSSSKKRRKRKKGGAGAKGHYDGSAVGTGLSMDGFAGEGETGAASVAATAPWRSTDELSLADSKGLAFKADEASLFEDRLVEESGILYADDVSLEEGRVPKPLELEVTVLAYAPHFLGFVVAAAAERSEESYSGLMPTGLCENSVWPDPEAHKKQAEMEKHEADPTRLLGLERLKSMRTLGKIYIHERETVKELRRILRDMLFEGLEKATKACRESAQKATAAAVTAADAAAAAAASVPDAAGSCAAATGAPDPDPMYEYSGSMRDDELESIRKSMRTNKKQSAKSRKKRNSIANCANTKKPASSSVISKPGRAIAQGPLGAETVVPLQNRMEGSSKEPEYPRKMVGEIRTEFADSDDEIPLPEGVLAFRSLEEAMLVRELRKDRLPGKIVRDRDESQRTVGGVFIEQPISELHLPSTSALVLCLRPRPPSRPHQKSAIEDTTKEELAGWLLEDGYAEGAAAEWGDLGVKELEKQQQQQEEGKEEAEHMLQALEARLSDVVWKRETRENNVEDFRQFRIASKQKAERKLASKGTLRSNTGWEAKLRDIQFMNEKTRQSEKVFEREVERLRSAVDLSHRNVEEDKEKALKSPLVKYSPLLGADCTNKSHNLFTRIKGLLFGNAKATFWSDKSAENAIASSNPVFEEENDDVMAKNTEGGSDGWNVAEALGNVSKASKPGGGRGGGKNKSNASIIGNSSSRGIAGGAAAVAEATDARERMRKDPMTNLHLWAFWRKNPLADGGALPWDEPAWPGPLKEVIVENTCQPTLEDLHQALGKAHGLPAERVWAVKHNLGRHEWVRLTPELGIKKMKKKKGKRGAGGEGKRQVTNLREAPYSLKDGDVVAVVDRLEDPEGRADLTRADDEAYREQDQGKPKAKSERRQTRSNTSTLVQEAVLRLGDLDCDDEDEDEEENNDDDSDDLADLGTF